MILEHCITLLLSYHSIIEDLYTDLLEAIFLQYGGDRNGRILPGPLPRRATDDESPTNLPSKTSR